MALTTINPADFLGRPPERLTLRERTAVTGKWMALEIYTPESLPLRVIEALGDTPSECIRQLEARRLDPRKFEFSVLLPAF
ncbi:MAG: hypothetical protein ABI972_12115 [Acidobacteriota bacterium]